MARPDFVREMKAVIQERKRKADQDQREKLHDSDIINTQGIKKWEALNDEVKSLVGEVGDVNYWPTQGCSFILKCNDRELTVKLDGAVKFSGTEKGMFVCL